MVPIDLAKHHITRKDHQLGGSAPLVGDRQSRACFIEAQATKQPVFIEVTSVGYASVEAIASEVIHLVDIDWARQQRMQNPTGRVGG